MTRKVFLAMLTEAGFTDARCAGTGDYRTSGHTQATFYAAHKPGRDHDPSEETRR